LEGFESYGLRGRLGRFGAEGFEGLLAEDYCSMAVGFEIDADVEFRSSVVQPFYSGGCADYGEPECLLDVFRRCAVCVCGLYDADFELVCESCFTG
jgi:hypothetical protein